MDSPKHLKHLGIAPPFWFGLSMALAALAGAGCAGLLEVQALALASPNKDDVKHGGGLHFHAGVSEDDESLALGYGGTIKVDVTEVHALVEQGVHGFSLTELDKDWALYGRIGGSAGMMVTELDQLSIGVFSQFGTMYCLSKRNARCISGGLHAHYTALFDGNFQHGPWLGLYLGFGSYWLND